MAIVAKRSTLFTTIVVKLTGPGCHTYAKLMRSFHDRLHTVLCASGYNVGWLLPTIAKKGLLALFWLLPAHLRPMLVAVLNGEEVLARFLAPRQ